MLEGRGLHHDGSDFEVSVNGRAVACQTGDTVLAVLLRAGVRYFRRSARTAAPRAPYCNMGVCYDCVVTIDGAPYARACMTDARPGMRIETDDQP